MTDKNILTFAGLHTSNNGFSAVPEGSLVEAHNVQIVQRGSIEPRRGRAEIFEGAVDQFIFHDDRALIHDNDTEILALVNTSNTSASAYSNDYAATDRAYGRIKTINADDRTYFNTSSGLMRLEDVTQEPELAGAPRTADVYSVEATSSTDGFLAVGYTCAYRVVFGKEDDSGNLILGPPSGRAFGYVASTDTDPRNMELTFPLSSGTTVNDFYRVYRSEQVLIGNEPSDNLALVIWKNFTSADIAAGNVTIVDTTPDELLGDQLYTNNTQEGILQSNFAPPASVDIALWAERMWFGNVKQEQNLELELLGIGEGEDGGTGLRAHDVITIAGRDYEAIYLDDPPANGQYGISTNADLAVAIEQTTRNLVAAINADTGNTDVFAYYLSGPDDLPGKFHVISRTKGTNPFNATLNPGVHVVDTFFRDGSTVVVTFTTGTGQHGFKVGDTFTLACSGTANVNFPVGTKTITAIPDSSKISYTEAGAGASVSVTGYTCTRITPEPDYAWNPELPYLASGTVSRSIGNTYVTVSTSPRPHGLTTGDTIQVETVSGGIATTGTKTITVTSSTTFTFVDTGVDGVGTITFFSGQKVASDADEVPHRLMYSKFQQYEAVPLLNFLDIGVKNKAILRVVPLGNSLIVFKEDGVYSVSGENTPWAVDLIDDTVHCLAPDSVQKVKGNIYAFTNQGVVQVDASGLSIVSGPIENKFVKIAQETAVSLTTRANVLRYSFAVPRETDRLYILYPITGTVGDVAYVYNVSLKTWTTWDGVHVSGGVQPKTDLLYLGSETHVELERRNLDETDYYDGEILTTSVSEVTGTYLNVSDTSGIDVGDVVFNLAQSQYRVVTEVTDNITLTFAELGITGNGDQLIIFKGYDVTLKLNTIVGSSVNFLKQFREFKIHFKKKFNYRLSVTTTSDLDPTPQTLDITDSRFDISDSLAWENWDEPTQLRNLVPLQHQTCTYFHFKLKFREAQAYWQLNGLSFTYELLSERTML